MTETWANMTDLEYLDASQVDGVLVVLSSNLLNIDTFVHQMGAVIVSDQVNKRGNMYLIWNKNNQYPHLLVHIEVL